MQQMELCFDVGRPQDIELTKRNLSNFVIETDDEKRMQDFDSIIQERSEKELAGNNGKYLAHFANPTEYFLLPEELDEFYAVRYRIFLKSQYDKRIEIDDIKENMKERIKVRRQLQRLKVTIPKGFLTTNELRRLAEIK